LTGPQFFSAAIFGRARNAAAARRKRLLYAAFAMIS
jgi:hypothetical protein